jgi:hypothetical protein
MSQKLEKKINQKFVLLKAASWQKVSSTFPIAQCRIVGEEVALWRLTSLSRWSKAMPCNFEESPYVAHIFSLRVICENVDIMFIEIYRIR